MTQAETLAARYGDDGQVWWDSNDIHLTEAAIAAGARIETTQDTERYVFPDGSAIVAGAVYWDLEGSRPFTYAGEEG